MDDDQLVFVRTLIDSGDPPLFTDAQIRSVYAETRSTWLTGAVLAERIAADMVLISRKIKTQDLETDGPAAADALRKLAAGWRQHAAQIAATAEFGMSTWAGPDDISLLPELTERPAWGYGTGLDY